MINIEKRNDIKKGCVPEVRFVYDYLCFLGFSMEKYGITSSQTNVSYFFTADDASSVLPACMSE